MRVLADESAELQRTSLPRRCEAGDLNAAFGHDPDMLWLMLLSEELRVWEQRVGYWGARCRTCQRDCWQLTYRIWRTKGNGLSPPTPYTYPTYGEVFQVRCGACGIAAMVGHPNQWVPPLGNAFVYETHPATPALGHYLQQAFPWG